MKTKENTSLGRHALASRKAQSLQKSGDQARTINNLSRRKFLEFIGKAGISTQLLTSSTLVGGLFANRYALANNELSKRLVYCYLPGGAANGQWLPTPDGQMNVCTKPYGPNGYDVAHICHFREVDVMMHGHSSAYQALGVTNYLDPTMDQRLASILNAYTPHSHLYVGVEATTIDAPCSTMGPCIDGVEAAYQRIFNSNTRNHRLDAMFAHHHETLQQLQNKVSMEEKQRLEQHADAMNTVAEQLDQGGKIAACTAEQPDLPEYNIQDHGKAMVDLIILALQCGLTNTATLQLANHQGVWRMHNSEFGYDFHSSQKSFSVPQYYNEMVAYLSEVPAYFIQQLMSKKGPDDEALIKSTVFAQVSCMGNGIDHSSENSPFILATQMPGFAPGFSVNAGGTTKDFNGTLPRGMGIADNLYQPMGERDLELLV